MGIRFKVKDLAEAQGIRQDELARRAGLKLSAVIGVWRNTVEAPRFDTLYAIAKALKVGIDDLYEETESGNWAPELLAA